MQALEKRITDAKQQIHTALGPSYEAMRRDFYCKESWRFIKMLYHASRYFKKQLACFLKNNYPTEEDRRYYEELGKYIQHACELFVVIRSKDIYMLSQDEKPQEYRELIDTIVESLYRIDGEKNWVIELLREFENGNK